jgi:hypothetical protein
MSERLWDTSDPARQDTRSVDERLADAIASELGGRRRAFLTVSAGWPVLRATSASVPAPDVVTAGRNSASPLVYLDWQ